MMKIIIISTILSAVCGTQYGYINNNLVEFDDPISIPYPYQETRLLRLEQIPTALQNALSVGVLPTSIPTQEIGQLPINLLRSLVSSALGYLKRSIWYIISSIPAMILGCFSYFGICNLTSLCNYDNLQSFLSGPGLSSLINSDRLKRAAEFVEAAFNKYRSLQSYY